MGPIALLSGDGKYVWCCFGMTVGKGGLKYVDKISLLQFVRLENHCCYMVKFGPLLDNGVSCCMFCRETTESCERFVG